MNEEVLPRQNLKLLEFELSNEVILHNEKAEEIHVLNLVAAHIFRCCDGVTPVSHLLGELKEMYPAIPEAKLSEDIRAALDGFRELSIVESD